MTRLEGLLGNSSLSTANSQRSAAPTSSPGQSLASCNQRQPWCNHPLISSGRLRVKRVGGVLPPAVLRLLLRRGGRISTSREARSITDPLWVNGVQMHRELSLPRRRPVHRRERTRCRRLQRHPPSRERARKERRLIVKRASPTVRGPRGWGCTASRCRPSKPGTGASRMRGVAVHGVGGCCLVGSGWQAWAKVVSVDWAAQQARAIPACSG